MKQIAHRPGIREGECRITRAEFRRTNDNKPVVYVTLTADDGEVFQDQFILDRDLERLEALRWAVGWWAPTLTGEKVGVLLDTDGAILGYVPAVQLDPSGVNLFPWSVLALQSPQICAGSVFLAGAVISSESAGSDSGPSAGRKKDVVDSGGTAVCRERNGADS